MKIAVCDDNAVERKNLCVLVREYCDRHSLNADVEEFENGEDLLRRMGQTLFSVVFLDIFLEKEHGVEIAQVIRENYADCILFFCTVSKEFALEGYELNIRHYLVKPIEYGQVEEAIDRCGGKLLSLARTLLVSVKPETRILVKDIIYVEMYNKDCHIHTTNGGIVSTRKSIVKLASELGTSSFLRCHRSFIVNMAHVREYDQMDFIMNNGERIPIRQTGRSGVKQAFRNYSNLRVAEMV